LHFVLHRGAGEVTGRVSDARTGQPVPGVFVGVGTPWAIDSSGGSRRGEWSRLARTDEAGDFRVEGASPGACSAIVRAPGYSLWRDEIEVREARTETVDAALLPEAALEGRALDREGRPVAGLSVIVGRPAAGWLSASDRTDAD